MTPLFAIDAAAILQLCLRLALVQMSLMGMHVLDRSAISELMMPGAADDLVRASMMLGTMMGIGMGHLINLLCVPVLCNTFWATLRRHAPVMPKRPVFFTISRP